MYYVWEVKLSDRVRSFCINISIQTLLDTFLKFRKEGMITQRQTNSLWRRSVVGSGCNSCRIETSMSISALPFPQGTRVKACFQEVVDGPWLRIELDFFSSASVNLICYVSSGAPLIPWRACLVFLSSKKKTWKKIGWKGSLRSQISPEILERKRRQFRPGRIGKVDLHQQM